MIRLIKKIIEKSTFIPIFIKINKCLTFSAELMQLSVLPFVSVDCTHKRIHDLLKQFCLICYLYMYMLDMLSLHVHVGYVISTCTCLICNLYMYMLIVFVFFQYCYMQHKFRVVDWLFNWSIYWKIQHKRQITEWFKLIGYIK